MNKQKKKCSKCLQFKSISLFFKEKRYKCGYGSHCKDCKNVSKRKYYQTERGKETHREQESVRRSKDKKSVMLTNAKARAMKNNLEFSITKKDIIFTDLCPVFDIKLDYNLKKISDNSPTIDRIDSKKGYMPDNIKIISWKANRVKSNASIEEIEAILSYMYDNNKNYRNKLGIKKGSRPTKHYTWNGKSQGLTDWAEELKINTSTLSSRINKLKWPVEKAFTTIVKNRGKN
jgi:hypothetical protein